MFTPLREPDHNDGAGGAVAAPTAPAPSGGLNADQAKIQAAVNKVAAAQPSSPGPKSAVRPISDMKPSAAALEGTMTDDAEGGDDAAVESLVGDGKPPVSAKPTSEPPKPAPKPQVQQQEQVEDPHKGQVRVSEPSKPAARDYTGYSAEEIAVLKQMSNPAFEFATKKLKELKTLQERKPDSYLQHPQAYILSPEFSKTVEDEQYAEFEANHWKAQLLNIRNGKKWKALTGFNEQGQPEFSAEQAATDEAEINVTSALSTAQQAVGQLRTKRNGIQQGFATQVQQSNAAIQSERAKRFEWVSDPSKLDVLVPLANGKEASIKQMIGEFKGIFPGHHQGNPLLDLCADMFVAVQVIQDKLAKATANAGREQTLREQIARAEPATDAVNGGTTVASRETVLDMEGLPE